MNIGAIYALMAAILNASVGTFSTGAFISGLSAEEVAFYKCLIAFCVLSIWVILIPSERRQCVALLLHAHKIALLALCGIFILYYFETTAYQFNIIATTVFTLQGISTLTTFVASQVILKVHHNILEWFSMLLAIVGLIVLYFSNNISFEFNLGLLFSAIAGIGYGLFLVLNKKISLPIKEQGVALLWWLLLFGCFFLFIPFSFKDSEPLTIKGWTYLSCLGFAGTIGGFYFTIKALSLMDASKVQLYELSEPVFASILGLIFFKQWITIIDTLGASLIFVSIYVLNRGMQLIKNVTLKEKLNES